MGSNERIELDAVDDALPLSPTGWRKWWAFGREVFRATVSVLHNFRGEDLGLRAAALTYVSIFSLVPLVTVAVAAVDGFGGGVLRERLLMLVRDVLAPGVAEDSAAFLERFMAAASSRAAGGLGLLTLLVSATMLLHNLDTSLNAIWNVRQRRPLPVRVVLYLGVLALGPLLLAVWLGSTHWLAHLLSVWGVPFSRQALSIAAPVLSVAGFTFVYRAAPSTRVRFRAALAGGAVAGLTWELAKVLYAQVAGHFVKSNPVYGALGAAPLFLIWLYTSWLLLLLGARLAYALQHARERDPVRLFGVHPRARELIAASLAQAAAAAHAAGEPAPTPRLLARRLRISEDRLEEVLTRLVRAELLLRTPEGGVAPARPLSELTLADLCTAVRDPAQALQQSLTDPTGGPFRDVETLFKSSDAAGLEQLRQLTWERLLQGLPAPGSGSAGKPSQKP